MFIVALFTMAKIQKQAKYPSSNEWIKMEDVYTNTHTHTHAHTYTGILFSHKKRIKVCYLQKHEWTYRVLGLVK